MWTVSVLNLVQTDSGTTEKLSSEYLAPCVDGEVTSWHYIHSHRSTIETRENWEWVLLFGPTPVFLDDVMGWNVGSLYRSSDSCGRIDFHWRSVSGWSTLRSAHTPPIPSWVTDTSSHRNKTREESGWGGDGSGGIGKLTLRNPPESESYRESFFWRTVFHSRPVNVTFTKF